ncbi:hypothetical protein LINPERHAP1_LOCUS11684, partial [Linum perenne]
TQNPCNLYTQPTNQNRNRTHVKLLVSYYPCSNELGRGHMDKGQATKQQHQQQKEEEEKPLNSKKSQTE